VSVLSLGELAREVVARARPGEQVEAFVARSNSTTVRVYEGELESLTSGQSHGVGVRVVVDGRQGFASAGLLDRDAVLEVLSEARANAAYAEVDPCVGLAEPDGVPLPELDLADVAGVRDLPEQAKIDMATYIEARARGADPRIESVRTTIWSDSWGEVAIASTTGIDVGSVGASCSVAVSPIARDGDDTQIGFAGDGARRPGDLDVDRVVNDAVERATGMLGATKPASERLTVVLDRPVAAAFVGIVAGMLTGGQVVKGRSPFADRLGQQVAADAVSLVDDPTDVRSLGADEHDGEGLATRPNTLIACGVLSGFLYDTYSARRGDVTSTASAVRGYGSVPVAGAQALQLAPGDISQDELVAAVGEGFFVDSVSGLHSGVNPVSGDFSVGVTGRRIRGGVLGEPHREATIASTLQRMLLDVVLVGGDLEWRPGGTGSVSLAIADVALSGT
jgi:PmbA protein